MMQNRTYSPRELLELSDEVLVRQCEVDHYRSRGPGGQKRNKTSSAVRLRHKSTGIIVTASEDRSQHVNLIRATRRLREAIALELRSALAEAGTPSSELLTKGVSANGDFQIGRRDPRYYLVIQELLDLLQARRCAVSDAAKPLGLSTSQFVKLLKHDPKVWERVNQMRVAAGMKPLQ